MKIIEELKKRLFPFFVLVSALSVSASAAFYSVTGLSKLFAGASLEVLIMASTLEIAKLIVASLLYQYWNEINKTLRFYLSLSVGVLIIITSMGIYGFLSSAYQETSTKYDIIQKEINILELKKERFTEDRNSLINEKTQLDNGINELRNGLANNVIQYKDHETGEIITTTSSSTRRVLENQLTEAVERRNGITNKLEAVTDSITSTDIKILNTETNSDVAAELGPLKYISKLINKPMGEVVNILLLVIIFVFDPLAISLVIAANFLFDNLKNKKDPKVIEEEKNKELSRKIVYRKRDAEN